MQNIEMAHKIANAAGCIDYLKQSPHISDTCRAEAAQHVNELHEVATQLAGDCPQDVYRPDESDDIRKILAAGQCVCEASDA